MAVGPDGLLRRRFFTAMTIALAFALWTLGGEADHVVRARVSPWSVVGATAHARWNALRSWARAAGRGELWPSIEVGPGWKRRDVAQRVVRILEKRGPPVDDVVSRVFAGAAQIR